MLRTFLIIAAMILFTAGQVLTQGATTDPFTGADSNLCEGICKTPDSGTMYRSGPNQTNRYQPPAPQQTAPTVNPNAPTINPWTGWNPYHPPSIQQTPGQEQPGYGGKQQSPY